MTHKEENIVNITVKAMELLNTGKIRQDEEQGFMGFTQEIISLAERFEKEYGHVDWNSGEHDYWERIDNFSEKALLDLYSPEPEQAQISAFRILGAYGEDLCWTVDGEVGLVEAINQLSTLETRREHFYENPVVFTDGEVESSPHKSFISPEDFKALASERMDNTGRVAGVYEMDFKHKVFSAVNIMDGWIAWKFSDVICASNKAHNSHDKLRTITEELQGKELTYFTHPASDIVKLSKLSLEEQMRVAEQKTQPTHNDPTKGPER